MSKQAPSEIFISYRLCTIDQSDQLTGVNVNGTVEKWSVMGLLRVTKWLSECTIMYHGTTVPPPALYNTNIYYTAI